jgi:phosphate-selective porin OprO and OprP
MVSAIAFSMMGVAYAQQAGAPVVAAGEDKLAVAMAEIHDLRQRLIALEARVGAKDDVDTLPAAKSDPSAVKVKLSPAPSLSTADGKTTFAIDGRVQVDAGTVIDDHGAGIGDDFDLRAMWIGFSGKADGVWRYKMQVGLENNQVGVKDAFIAFDGIKNMPVMVGNFYENNGIEIFSGSTNTVFMEGASGITSFRPFRYLGVSADPYGENWGAQIGVFGEGVPEKAAGAGGDGYSFASRFRFAPVYSGDNLLHLGASYRLIRRTRRGLGPLADLA